MNEHPLGVVEVDAAQVTHDALQAVAETLRAVEHDLELPGLHVRWFAFCTESTGSGSDPVDDPALLSLSLGLRLEGNAGADLFGHANAEVSPPVCWLRHDLPPHVAAVVAAHEARHVWQRFNWDPEKDALFKQAEEDADAYALRAPWPDRFRDAIPCEAMLDLTRVRAARFAPG